MKDNIFGSCMSEHAGNEIEISYRYRRIAIREDGAFTNYFESEIVV